MAVKPKDTRTINNKRSESTDYQVDQQIGFFLRQANQRHVSIFNALIGDKLTTTQWAALTKLRQAEPCSQNQLGRDTAMDVATIKGVVDRMVKRGYVQTAADQNDGRRLVLQLTDEGRAVIDGNLAAALQATENTLEPLTAGERMMFVELLRKIT